MIKVCTTAIVLFIWICPAYSSSIVAPNPTFETNEGNSSLTVPFNGRAQIQMLFESSLFSEGPLRITGLRVRQDASQSASGTFNTSGFRVDMSSTTVNASTAGSNFNNNHGVNRATVFNSALTLTYSSGNTPNNFSSLINLNPFDYDPTSGESLIIHFFNFDNLDTGEFFVDREVSPAIAGTFIALNTSNPDSDTATFTRQSDSMIILLETESLSSVPEPSTFIFLCLALFACPFCRRITPNAK